MASMHLAEALSTLLADPCTTERQVHGLLKQHVQFIIGMFATSWNFADAYPEVPFGADFRADFLVLCANSGYWVAHVIELKGPNALLYNKSRDKSKELRYVERQLAQRVDWRRQNEQAFRQVLAKVVPPESPAQCSHASEHQRAVPEILDPRTVIRMECHAVIGRSSSMSPDERERRRLDDQNGSEQGSPSVLTYDRLLVKALLQQRGAI